MPESSEVLTRAPMPPEVEDSERRARKDRREESTEGRRGSTAHSRKRRIYTLLGDLVAIVVLAAAIVYAVNHERPIFAGQHPVVQSLIEGVPPAKPLLAPVLPPPDTGRLATLIASPQFAADSAAFSADLVRTGRMSPQRADSIAFYAVREAYDRGIPPAVIFGVMLTENALFVSNALSNVGAVGLMQVYPKIWLKALGDKFGTDLASDSTNVKYGVYILSEYIKPKKGTENVTAGDVQKGLLRYNGCVRGTNTRGCGSYPDVVRREVERSARSSCHGADFDHCVVEPMWLARRDPVDTVVLQNP
jgi:hypothetical protein